MFKGKRYVLLEGSPGATGGGDPAPAAATTPPAATATAAPSGDAQAPAAISAGTPGGDGPGAPGSALSAGSAPTGDAGAGGDGSLAAGTTTIPDKFQVKNDKGELDPLASAAKVAQAYAELERRMGQGLGARPKTAAEYKLPELPEALKDAQLEGGMTDAFREKAHKAGLSQSQFDFVMGEYFDLAPQLVAGGSQSSADDTVAELKTAWGKDYQAQAANAWRGVSQIAQAAGLTVPQVEAELGNNAAFNRIMAAVGAQLREDTSISTGGMGAGGASMADAATLQASEAFRNPRHPEHAATVAKWNRIVTKGVPDTPLM